MKIIDFKHELEVALYNYYHSTRSSGDGSGFSEEAVIQFSDGQNLHEICISNSDQGIIITLDNKVNLK